MDSLGYDTSSVGAIFFTDLIDEVYSFFSKGRNEKEIAELLPSIYLENYHFDYGVGRKRYFIEIENFLESKVIDKKSRKVNRRLSLLKNKLTLDELIIFLSKYFYELDKDKKKQIHAYELTKRNI